MDAFYDAVREYKCRVVHGRTGFDPSFGQHIRLLHVPSDEFHVQLRESSRTLDPEHHDEYLPQGSRS
ncbi:MAG: hypothetical protein P8Q52_03110 [Acidimicrobiales bacterium]|nr:hypothetical protein [Acidimicrobiales bacterium]